MHSVENARVSVGSRNWQLMSSAALIILQNAEGERKFPVINTSFTFSREYDASNNCTADFS